MIFPHPVGDFPDAAAPEAEGASARGQITASIGARSSPRTVMVREGARSSPRTVMVREGAPAAPLSRYTPLVRKSPHRNVFPPSCEPVRAVPRKNRGLHHGATESRRIAIGYTLANSRPPWFRGSVVALSLAPVQRRRLDQAHIGLVPEHGSMPDDRSNGAHPPRVMDGRPSPTMTITRRCPSPDDAVHSSRAPT